MKERFQTILDISKLNDVDLGSGVYVIVNMISGSIYLGSSENMRKRRNGHIASLRAGKHINRHLQRSFDLYGEEVFRFLCVEHCAKGDLANREQAWLDRLWSAGITLYNIYRQAYAVRGEHHPMFGKSHSAEARQKIRARRQAQVVRHSEETKAKIGAGNKGKQHSEESKRKVSLAKQGKSRSWNKGLTVNDPRIAKGIEKITVRLDDEALNRALTLYSQGASVNEVVRATGRSWRVIAKHLKAHGMKIRSISEQKRIRDQGGRL